MALRPLSDDKEISAVPGNEPILIELPVGVDADGDEIDGMPERRSKRQATPADDGASTLEEQLEAARTAQKADRERAERAEAAARDADARARARIADAERAQQRAAALESDVINGGLRAAQADLASAKAELIRAGEAGDYAALGEAQSRIARAQTQIVSLESGAAEIAERRPGTRQEPQTQQRQLTWAESVQQNPNLMTSERDWMLAHEADFKSAGFDHKLNAAYQGAINNGLVRGTPEYFDHIERATGLKRGQRAESQEDEIQMSAPVNRREPGADGRSRSSNQVLLSPEQHEIVKSLEQYGVTAKDYALNVRKFEQARRDDPERYTSRS